MRRGPEEMPGGRSRQEIKKGRRLIGIGKPLRSRFPQEPDATYDLTPRIVFNTEDGRWHYYEPDRYKDSKIGLRRSRTDNSGKR